MKAPIIAAIAPQFFSPDIRKTLAWYEKVLGFETQFLYGDPVFYAGAIRDGHSIFFRYTEQPPTAPNKYDDEFLDVYLRVNDIHVLYEDYNQRGAPFHRPLADKEWGFTEFVVKDCDGRLLCFGQETNPERTM